MIWDIAIAVGGIMIVLGVTRLVVIACSIAAWLYNRNDEEGNPW
jgi:hypothetical protein